MINDATSILMYEYVDVTRKICSFITSHNFNYSKMKKNDNINLYYLYLGRQIVLRNELRKRGVKI